MRYHVIGCERHVAVFGKKCLRKVNIYELWVNMRKYYNMLSKGESTRRISLDKKRNCDVLVSCLCG